jgi:hypothetical protein
MNYILNNNNWEKINYTPSSADYKRISLFDDNFNFKGIGFFNFKGIGFLNH